jgi:hypothetical protein
LGTLNKNFKNKLLFYQGAAPGAGVRPKMVLIFGTELDYDLHGVSLKEVS